MTLTSITKSTYLKEGLDALRLAKKVKDEERFYERFEINQNSDQSRKTCLYQIKKRYLKIEDGKVCTSPLVRLIDFSEKRFNFELMYYNYLLNEPTLQFTIQNHIFPKLKVNEEIELTRKEVSFFLDRHLDYSDATIRKTARSIVKALIDFGLAKSENNTIYMKFYSPKLLSVMYGFYNEYGKDNTTGKNYNILTPSLEHIREKAQFYKLFLINPSALEDYLRLGWEKDYLGYEPTGGLNQYTLLHKTLDGFINYLFEKGA